eukprot:TRINITY_DN4689_c0_g1_i6.p1 TRINITY_DN4689_c0_g1~~TRINITY_DN4689_c0_g1_i6.p1  ORF type:complete len:423 (+),score=9.47 TRINITY_DN4689_c0_g1_i6:450-1718(+)
MKRACTTVTISSCTALITCLIRCRAQRWCIRVSCVCRCMRCSWMDCAVIVKLKVVNVFAYGESGTGKTNTLFGSESEPGVAQLILETIGKFIESQNEKECLLKTSFFEIVDERVNDLSCNNKDLQISENQKGEVKIRRLREIACKDISGGMELLSKGVKSAKGRTHSSLIYSITIQSKVNTSTINIIKLCASNYQSPNSIKSKSLIALNSIIKSITADSKVIPYKESKLTQYLKNSFNGNTKIAVICNVSPAYTSYEETMSTLCFAIRASQVNLPSGSVSNCIDSLSFNVNIRQDGKNIGTMRNSILDCDLSETKIMKGTSNAKYNTQGSNSLASSKDEILIAKYPIERFDFINSLESTDETKQEELKRVILSSEKNYICELVFDCASKIRVLSSTCFRKCRGRCKYWSRWCNRCCATMKSW